jgi:hypothetical protein
MDLEIGRAQRNDPVEHSAADIGDDALADPGDEVEAAKRRTGEQDDDADKHKNSVIERRCVGALEPVIDEPAQPLTEPQHGRRGGEQSQHRSGHAHPIWQGEYWGKTG